MTTAQKTNADHLTEVLIDLLKAASVAATVLTVNDPERLGVVISGRKTALKELEVAIAKATEAIA